MVFTVNVLYIGFLERSDGFCLCAVQSRRLMASVMQTLANRPSGRLVNGSIHLTSGARRDPYGTKVVFFVFFKEKKKKKKREISNK